MFTGEGLIQLLVTMEEANVLQQSLASYTGPYAQDAMLLEHEKTRQAAYIAKADAMRDVIEEILTERYHREEEYRTLCDMALI